MVQELLISNNELNYKLRNYQILTEDMVQGRRVALTVVVIWHPVRWKDAL